VAMVVSKGVECTNAAQPSQAVRGAMERGSSAFFHFLDFGIYHIVVVGLFAIIRRSA